jgi:shikimate kinase
MPEPSPRRIVLLGFMASGKSAVGRALAERLGWRHVDLDDEIEKRLGATVQEIFAERGEAAFRALEVSLTPEVLARECTILSPGGGWITNPGLFDRLPPDTLTVWLRVSPGEVARRLASDPHQPVRPLLSGPEGVGRIEALLAAREPLYGAARLTVETDGRGVAEIVDELESVVSRMLEV